MDLSDSIRDFGQALRRFENKSSFPDSVRFHIPNALDFLYTVRNKRSVGHVGGDVDPNHMDAEAVVGTANWVMAELVRIFHGTSIEEAQSLVDALVEKRIPLVWEVAGKKRVLETYLTNDEATLVLLYHAYPDPVGDRQLQEWCEVPRFYDYRTRNLEPLHGERLIEYDSDAGLVHLSPKGREGAEELLAEHDWEL